MKNCTYFVKANGKTLSYSQLLDWIDSLSPSEWQSFDDLVFSIAPILDRIYNQLLNLNKEYHIERKARNNILGIIDGDVEIKDKDSFSINEFLESDLCEVGSGENRKRIVTLKNDEDYRLNFVEKQVKLGATAEQANKLFDILMENNEKLLDDSLFLHSLLTSPLIRSTDEGEAKVTFAKLFKDGATERLNQSILSDLLFNGLKYSYITTKGDYPNSKAIHNLNLKSKLNDIAKSIVGHIDHLYIDLDGTLHLYNFKVSSQTPKEWASAKVEKYKALLVFLKHMLSENGINVRHIDLNIIPVHLRYNSDFTKVEEIRVLNPEKYSARKSDGTYALEHYDKLVSRFLNDNYVPDGISDDLIVKGTETIKRILPDLNIREDGIGRTAEEWIRTAPDQDPYNVEPLVIEDVHLPNHGYNLIVRKKDGSTETIIIKSDRSREKNEELLNAVKEHVNYLDDNKGYLLKTLKNLIKEGYTKGNQNVFDDALGLPSLFLKSIFSKYLSYTEDPDTKKKTFDWELMEDLSRANVLMFKHNKTNLLDVISLSSFNLNVSPKMRKGKSILGYYRQNVETNVFEGDFGNIELIRILSLLNEVAPNLGKGLKLGMITSINTQSETQRGYSANYLNRVLFSKILEVVNRENPNSLPIINNLKECSFMNEIDVLLNEYVNITELLNPALKEKFMSLGFLDLANESNILREYALFNIMSNIYNIESLFRNPKTVLEAAKGSDSSEVTQKARLLLLASQAYLAVRGEQVLHKSILPTLDTLVYTALNVPDLNIRIVANNLLITHDTISSEFMELFYGMDKDGVINKSKSYNQIFEDFFNAKGYSKLQTLIVNNESSQFSNLYERDELGRNKMIFKNPYINLLDNTYLTPDERVLLKKILFAINSITNKNGFNYTSEDSPALMEYIKKHKEYFYVPLLRASNATMRQSMEAIKASMKHSIKLVKEGKERFEEVVNDMLSEEADIMEEGLEYLSLENSFALSMPIGRELDVVNKKRRELLSKYGPEFFETNLRSLFIDYLFKSISTEQYNKFLVGTKALILSLHITNNYGGNDDVVQKEILHIEDYLKVNVFSRTIMEKRSQLIMSVVLPIKSKVTNMLLMGNVVSALRDTVQGVLENMTRSVIKLNTDISTKNVTKAYKYVSINQRSNPRAVNLLSKLCLKFRLSNTDVARISERAKSDRGGIYNLDNKLYGTMRSPDFLNRMTLFVAKCMLDGCWEAWSLDENGELKYDWRKDKRFNLLASQLNIDSDEFRSQRSLYFSKIREYNMEHPELTPLEISLDTDLPSPYSNKDILSIRSVADNIYGSYDKSKKGMYENWALGMSFGMFTTWFNGIYNNYFGKAGEYATNKLKWVQDTDSETGLLLYFDKNGNITTEAISDDGTPNDIAWKSIPIMTQGIFPTLGTLYKILKNDGKDGLRDYLKANEGERANIRKLLADLLMSTLFLLLFKGLFFTDWDGLNGEYNDYKKTAKDNPLIQNLVTEILYKSSSRAYDSFLGPINVIQLLGDNMNPPYYAAPIKLLLDSWKTLLGEKQFTALMTDSFGFARAFKDTYKAELRK